MSSVFLTLDTSPPANLTVSINGGETLTGDRSVTLTIGSTDFDAGHADAVEMKVWGDLDPIIAEDQILEADSIWQPFATTHNVALENSTGRKRVYVRARDDVGNETEAATDFIDLDLDNATVVITDGVPQAKISRVTGFNLAPFTWESTKSFTDYQVRVVPASTSPVTSGTALGSFHGSENVSGTGSFPATTPIETTVNASDLIVASPGNTAKIIKVFVKDAVSGDWSH